MMNTTSIDDDEVRDRCSTRALGFAIVTEMNDKAKILKGNSSKMSAGPSLDGIIVRMIAKDGEKHSPLCDGEGEIDAPLRCTNDRLNDKHNNPCI